MLIYLNGKYVSKEDAKISIFDHGLLYGDGVFEGIRSYDGVVFKLDEHLKRLYDSAKAIMLEMPVSIDEMKELVLDTLRKNELHDAYIRLVVTRGEGDLGLDPDKCPDPTVFVIADKIMLYPEKYYKNGLELVTASTRRNIPVAINPRIKSLNYLNNILAKIEGKQAGAIEAIMLNSNGYVVECTGDNIFMIKNETLLTPPLYVGALEGITRNTVMDLAEGLSLQVKEEVFTQYDLYTADECFLTGTAAEVIPVVKVDRRVISDGKPGPMTQKLIAEFRRNTDKLGTEIYA